MRRHRLGIRSAFWCSLLIHLVQSATAAAPPSVPWQGYWTGSVRHLDKPWALNLRVAPLGEGVHVCMDFPDFGLYMRCADVAASDRGGFTLTYTSGRDTVKVVVRADGDEMAGTWSGLGVEGTVSLRRETDPTNPITEEDVGFSNSTATLHGTLLLPKVAGPVPAVVWIHGSGKQTRNEDFYRDRGYLLAFHGVASLIFDKRGTGQSTADNDPTLEDLAQDVRSALEMLRARRDICAVGVAGFSQGGFVAPMIAATDPRLAFVAVGSAAGVSPREQNDFAVANDLRRKGFGENTVERVLALRARVDEARRASFPDAELGQALDAASREPWFGVSDLPKPPLDPYTRGMLGVLDFAPLDRWRQVRAPVLAMWGESDRVVPAAQSRDLIEKALHDANNRDVVMRTFPSVGHGFLLPDPKDSWDWPRLAPGFHELLVQWVAQHGQEACRAQRPDRPR